jgi:hypothetical protein
VIVSFRVAGKEAGANTLTRADGIAAETYYHFVVWPEDLSPRQKTAEETARDEVACAAVDPEPAQTIAADDEFTAAEGAWFLGEIARRSVDAKDVLVTDCTKSFARNAEECSHLLASLRREDIGWIKRCETAKDENQEDRCMRIEVDGPQLELRVLVNSDNRIDHLEVSLIAMSRDPIPD